MRGLLISVGTGVGGKPESITHAIELSIKEKNPERVAFLVSAASKENAQKVVEVLELSAEDYCLFEVSEPNDLNMAFLEAQKAINWLISQGISTEEIISDFTSGTKPMSAAVVTASILRNINRLSYVQGMRKNGIVVQGTEQTMHFSPFLIFCARCILEAKEYLKKYQYEAALKILQFAQDYEAILDEEKKKEIKNLLFLISAYNYWDKFNHLYATGEFRTGHSPKFRGYFLKH